MATKRRVRSYTYTAPYWMLAVSFWVVVIAGLCMAAVGILNAARVNWSWFVGFANWVKGICFTIGMFVPVALSFRIAHHWGKGWFIIWIICVILVIVGIVTSLI